MSSKAKEDDWLEALEAKVKQATKEIARLRKQVAELESALEKAGSAGSGSSWAEEREEVRKRVETLVEHLSTLLEDES